MMRIERGLLCVLILLFAWSATLVRIYPLQQLLDLCYVYPNAQ